MRRSKVIYSIILSLFLSLNSGYAQVQEYSVARVWMEELLHSIRNERARPTVHARNLFHLSAAMYDAWVFVEGDEEDTYLLGKTVNGQSCMNDKLIGIDKSQLDVDVVLSHAAFTLLHHRFQFAERFGLLSDHYSRVFSDYDLGFYSSPAPTNLPLVTSENIGSFIGQCYVNYGLNDGSNEVQDHENRYYVPANPPISPQLPGNPLITDLNRFQQIQLDVFIGQSGFESGELQEFLSPEWGDVWPFAMNESDRLRKNRDGNQFWVYHDPGDPPYFDDFNNEGHDFYKWNFSLVSIWSSHLSPDDGVMWDISPAAIGNNNKLPEKWDEYESFYQRYDGGDASQGYALNPATGQPYDSNIVPRGDYTRVLAEFWADGPESETPPGHWFTILNYVNDHPDLEKRFKGEGDLLDDLEWDVKAYFTLGGAMHDAAIAAWSVKGFYDYIRPVSAIRGLSDLGQAVNRSFESYNEESFGGDTGFIEVVDFDDPLALGNFEAVGELKLNAWRGPTYIGNPLTTKAGVGWILAKEWWPYQRPTFVTPPFAGYVSGHSTFSRAAAEVLTLLTGDPFFPGGMGEFHAQKNEFLVFEEGPSVDVTLQWATYRDASDQTSLSRIWGGIHPPIDDILGRKMGIEIGIDAFNYAESFFSGKAPSVLGLNEISLKIGPNPVSKGDLLNISLFRDVGEFNFQLLDFKGNVFTDVPIKYSGKNISLDTQNLPSGIYILRMYNNAISEIIRFVVQ